MKKSLIISSLLGLSATAFAQTTKIQRIYIDPSSSNFGDKMQSIKLLKESNVLQPHGKGWTINKELLNKRNENLALEIESLREILGPGIQIDEVDAFDIVLASQDIRF